MQQARPRPLGRIFRAEDRDPARLMARVRQAAPPLGDAPTARDWAMPPPLDQGMEPHCVGYTGELWELGEPHHTTDAWDGETIYWAARDRDDLDDEQYPEGTTILGALRFLTEDGRTGDYLWAETVDDIIWWLLHKGPVWAGTNWYTGMDEPDSEGVLHPTGAVRGGHAYLLVGVDAVGGWIKMQNSWGPWGWNGTGQAWLTFADMAFLLGNHGEAVGVDEVPR